MIKDVMKKERLITKPFLFVGLITLLINGITSIQLLVLPLYTLSLGGNDFWAGIISAGFTLTSLLFKGASGRAVGKHGLRWPLIIGFGFCTVISFFIGLVPVLPFIFIFRILYGCGNTFASTSIGKAAADNTPKSRLMEGMGYVGLVTSLAMSGGNALAVYFGDKIGYSQILHVSTLFMALTVVLCLLFMKEKYVSLPKDISAGQKNGFSIWKEKKALPFAFSYLLSMMASCTTMTFLVPYCNSIGLVNISPYFIISTISSIVVRVTVSRFTDGKNVNRIIIPCFAIALSSFIFLPFISSSIHLYILGAFNGAASGMLTPFFQGTLVKHCPGRSGNASALYYTAIDAGFGIGGILFGLIASSFGYRIMYFIAAGISASAFISFLLAQYKQPLAVESLH